MTEEQLLAQSADDYMNAGQLEFFKRLLLEKDSSVRNRIADNHALCKIERHSDASDNASTEEDRAKALRLIDMDNQTLQQISLALTAISEDTYGWCNDTGEPITLKRLLLIPESLLSVDAMQARESRNKHQRAA